MCFQLCFFVKYAFVILCMHFLKVRTQKRRALCHTIWNKSLPSSLLVCVLHSGCCCSLLHANVKVLCVKQARNTTTPSLHRRCMFSLVAKLRAHTKRSTKHESPRSLLCVCVQRQTIAMNMLSSVRVCLCVCVCVKFN